MQHKWLIVLLITCLVGVAFFIGNASVGTTAEKTRLSLPTAELLAMNQSIQ
ncbi:hypothetical protein ACR3I8_09800 [Priestia flexa]